MSINFSKYSYTCRCLAQDLSRVSLRRNETLHPVTSIELNLSLLYLAQTIHVVKQRMLYLPP